MQAGKLDIPSGVVADKAGIGDAGVYEYCKTDDIPILLEIPYDKEIAIWYSNGIPFVERMPGWKGRFLGMVDSVMRQEPIRFP